MMYTIRIIVRRKIIPGTNVEKLTDLLMNMGLERKNQFQELKENITIYPQEYFSIFIIKRKIII